MQKRLETMEKTMVFHRKSHCAQAEQLAQAQQKLKELSQLLTSTRCLGGHLACCAAVPEAKKDLA